MTRPAMSRDRFRRMVDRAVAVARIVSVLGCMGKLAAVAAAAWAAMLIAMRLLPLAGAPTPAEHWLTIAAAAATAIAAWPVIRTAAAAWPTRLAVAVAAERSHPRLGERISRAVEFLDDGAAVDSPVRGSASLRALAVEQAAEAAGHIGGLPVPSLRRQLCFVAAGGLAVAILAAVTWATSKPAASPAAKETAPAGSRSIATATMDVWRKIETIRGQLAGGIPPTHAAVMAAIAAAAADSRQVLASATGAEGGVLAVFAERLSELEQDPADTRGTLDDLSALARGAARVADAAAFERRLASLLQEWFALAPGDRPADLPAPIRTGLDRAAALEEGCAAGIAADRGTLLDAARGQSSGTKGIARAAALLARIDHAASGTATDAIRDNRLAIAAESAGRAAALLEQAAALLGMTGTGMLAGPISNPALGPALPPSSAGIARGQLDRIPDAIASGTEASPTSTVAGGKRSGIDGATATTSPTSGTVTGPRTAAEPPGVGNGIDRAWLLLQERSYPQRPQGGELLAFPSHRRAIDAYYRLLLESARGRKPPSSQP